MSKTVIKGIRGAEHHRDGEEPYGYWGGHGFPKVTQIEVRSANHGAYDVYIDDNLVASMNAMHVAEVIYESATAETTPVYRVYWGGCGLAR